jgi:hypothetical protein
MAQNDSKYNDTFRDLIMDLDNIPAMMQKQREGKFKKNQDMAPAGIRLNKQIDRNTSSKEGKSHEPEDNGFQVSLCPYNVHGFFLIVTFNTSKAFPDKMSDFHVL